MEERLTELELRFMQQEKTLQELSDTVYRQEQQIVRMERDMVLVVQQLKTLVAASLPAMDEDERPPHY